jgi:capping protein beta
LDLLRRLDPKSTSDNLTALCKIAPDLAEDLLSSVDQPLGVKTCQKTKRDYLTCDYNRDGDSYRSPWSNEYEPYISDGPMPSDKLRETEEIANSAFDVYRELYYEGGISSVYLWDQDDGFAGVVLLKKHSETASGGGGGVWDSIHVFEVAVAGKRSATYRFTSTVILSLDNKTPQLGSLDLSGNLTRQTERVMTLEDPSKEAHSHVVNIGTLVEEIESRMRNVLNEVYFGKSRDIVDDLRTIETSATISDERKLQSEVAKGLSGAA